MADQPRDLENHVVLVAGASSGMGRATAIAAAAAGATLVVASRNRPALDEVVASLRATGAPVLTVPTDMTDLEAVTHLAGAARREFGRIDAVVNTVGTNIPRRVLDELTPESWSDLIATNLTSAFHLTQAVVPIFRDQGGGLLIHVSSSAAKRPDLSGITYQATKAGLVGLAHGTMEEERKHGVRTTVIFPGLTDTPMVEKRPTPTPPEVLRHALQPEDVAAACLFVMRLPARAHVPELLLYPSRL
jgi:NAD(P)-dependent dehydrogenase (short-subunit alcohol dehydrogenase family)